MGETDAVLMCSLGKDSLVCLDLMAPRFRKVYCVFMYFVKGLEHVEKYISWIRAKYTNVEVVQIPHWNLSYVIRSGLYCVANPNVKLIKLADVCQAMRLRFGVNHVVLGMKKADGMNRNLMLKTYEEKGYLNNGLAYPLAEWKNKDVDAYIKQKCIPLPVKYGVKKSNGIGFNLDCFLWMKEFYPQDLEKIYSQFPLSRRILFEYNAKQEEEKSKSKFASINEKK